MADTTHTIRIRMDTSGVQQGTQQVQAGLRQTEAAAGQATQKVGLLGAAFARLRTQVLGLNSALVGFSAGFAALSAVRSLADFDAQMASVRAVTLATEEEFQKFRQTALEFGETTRFSAVQAAEGLELLGRAGASAADSVKLLPTTLRLAQAENLSTAETADTLVKVLAGMRLGFDQADKVADLLSATASKTTTDVRELGVAFRYGATSAAGFKVPIEEVSAALGILAQNGQTGSLGGTGFRGFLSRLAAPTKEFLKDLKATGVGYDEVNPKYVSFIDILKRFREAQIGASESFQLFNQRSGNVVEILVNNIPQLETLLGQLRTVEGTLAQKSAIQENTLRSDFLKLLASVNSLIYALGDAGLTTALRTVAQVFRSVFLGAAEAVRVLVPLVTNIGIAFAAVFSPAIIAAFAVGLVRLAPLFGALAVQAARAAAAVALFAVANPFTALAVAIGVAITLVQNFGDRIGVIGTQFATLQDLFEAVGNRIGRAFSAVSSAAAAAFQSVVNAAAAAANFLTSAFDGAINAIVGKINQLLALENTVSNKIRGLVGSDPAAPLQLGGVDFSIKPPSIVADVLREADDIAAIRREEELGAALRSTYAEIQRNTVAKQAAGEATRNLGGEEENLRSQYSRTRDVLDQVFGQQTEALANIATLNKLFSEGRVTVSEYADQLQRFRASLLQNDQTLQGGILKGLNSVAEGATRLGDSIGNAVANGFATASDAIADFAVTGKFNFQDLTSSILRDMTRLASNAIFGSLINGLLGGIGGGAIGGGGLLGGGGGLGSLFGFASGGSARVGGSGGTDSKVVAFRATPGELIDVRTPGQARGDGGQMIVNVNVQDIPGAQVDQRRSRSAGGADVLDITISAVNQAISSGKMDGSLRGRFGFTPTTVRR